MNDAERFQLLGKYRTPRFRNGRTVFCEVRGERVITGRDPKPTERLSLTTERTSNGTAHEKDPDSRPSEAGSLA